MFEGHHHKPDFLAVILSESEGSDLPHRKTTKQILRRKADARAKKSNPTAHRPSLSEEMEKSGFFDSLWGTKR